jgi:glyoxylase-like metal-dependent hydrolase (beta-lactamase superfamily II)
MDIKTIVVGELEENCYLLIKDNECVIIDPGDEFERIKKEVGDLKVVGCLITHFHQDHIGALEEVISYYDLEVNKVKSKKFKFEIIKTPGHTIDSKTFYFKKAKIMFCGDFIFERSIGRTDLGGNDEDMKDSLKMISEYPDDITLYPGHGESTTLGKEKKYFSYYY